MRFFFALRGEPRDILHGGWCVPFRVSNSSTHTIDVWTCSRNSGVVRSTDNTHCLTWKMHTIFLFGAMLDVLNLMKRIHVRFYVPFFCCVWPSLSEWVSEWVSRATAINGQRLRGNCPLSLTTLVHVRRTMFSNVLAHSNHCIVHTDVSMLHNLLSRLCTTSTAPSQTPHCGEHVVSCSNAQLSTRNARLTWSMCGCATGPRIRKLQKRTLAH